MRRVLVAASIFVFAAAAAIAVGTGHAQAGATTCVDKHCPNNTHCCYGCTGNPICVRNGVPCPECAPQ